MEIQQALKTKVDVRFTNRPLAEVLDTLGNLSGVNIHLDQQGLHAEGVTSDTPVTLNLTQPISLRSALNLILQELRLSYVIQNEVLNVTSEQTRDSNVYPQVYNVADLVIPIPNFIPSYNVGLPGAIAAAHRALGYGASAPTYGSGPLTVAANGEGMGPATTSASVLAQMGSAGVLGGPRSQQTSQPSAIGPGGMGGGGVADFDSLIQLITSTIAPTSWDDVGGPGSIEGFATNLSLVVSQTQEVHEQIADLLDQLRRLQDLQVTIEVRFITLNDNFFERIGIDFDFSIQDGYKGPLPDDEPPSLVLGLQPTTNFTPPLTGVDSTPDRNIAFSQGSFASAVPQFGGFDAATAANFGFAILSDIEVFFLLQAAQGDQRTNILQAPKVTLFNGQQATISDNSQTPFVTSIIPVVGDFAAAHQPVIVVLSEGTSMNVQAVVSSDRRFVRLTLVPFFSKIGDVKEFTFNGKVTTKSGKAILDPTGKNLLGRNEQETTMEGTTVQLPTFSFTTVTTTVSVPDGGTVLLGGIKRLREGRNERGVPMLSKLPYVNRLFKNVGIGRETQSLMMMVTPRIIIQEEEEEKTVGRPSLP
jgi:general secretion pathway protein D